MWSKTGGWNQDSKGKNRMHRDRRLKRTMMDKTELESVEIMVYRMAQGKRTYHLTRQDRTAGDDHAALASRGRNSLVWSVHAPVTRCSRSHSSNCWQNHMTEIVWSFDAGRRSRFGAAGMGHRYVKSRVEQRLGEQKREGVGSEHIEGRVGLAESAVSTNGVATEPRGPWLRSLRDVLQRRVLR